MSWKITKNIDNMKHFVTPVGVMCFDVTMETEDKAVADYFSNFGMYSGNTPMYTVEEICDNNSSGSE